MKYKEVTGFKLFLFIIFVLFLFCFNFYLFFVGLTLLLKLFKVAYIGKIITSILFVFGFFASSMVTLFMIGFISFYFGLRFKSESEWNNYTPNNFYDNPTPNCDSGHGESGGDCNSN